MAADTTPKIVVIDDSATSISLYALSTAPLDVSVEAFRSPFESLEFLRDNHADIVFLDLVMPGLDGLGVLKKIRAMARHKNTPVIVVTSKDYAQDRSTAKALGAVDYLVKPLKSQEIRAVIFDHTHAQTKSVDNDSIDDVSS